MHIVEIQHKHAVSYLIQGTEKWVLFDAGWPDSYSVFSRVMTDNGIQFKDIAYLLVSHFHMDHCGIAEHLKDKGVILLLHEAQADGPGAINQFFVHNPNKHFRPITQQNSSIITSAQSRTTLGALGLAGEIVPTPGHSDDSISLALDNKTAFVGDLPQHDLAEAYSDPIITQSWKRLTDRSVKHVYPAHGVRYTISSLE